MKTKYNIHKQNIFIDENLVQGEHIKIKLINYFNNELNNEAKLQLESICNKYKLELKELHYVDELILFSIKHISLEALEQIKKMNSILSITKMPRMFLD